MKRTVLLASLAIVLVGCGKDEESTGQSFDSPPNTEVNQGAEAGSAAPQPPSSAPIEMPTANDSKSSVAAATTASGEPDLEGLTIKLRMWMRDHRTGPPKSFEAWAASANVQVPQPPPGKKYVITKSAWVVLEDK